MIRMPLKTAQNFAREALTPCWEDFWSFGSDITLCNHGLIDQEPKLEQEIDRIVLEDQDA